METVAPVLDVVNGHPYLSSVSIILGCAALARLVRWRSHTRLPPGPKGYPIIGNLLDLPPTHVWEKFGTWGKQYGRLSFLLHVTHVRCVCMLIEFFAHAGGVTYINVLGQEMVILNSSKAAVDLLDKRSAIYSNRPIVVMGGEIVGWNRSLALTQYGPRFRDYRKYMSKLIGTRASMERFTPLQERETAKFVARVMADPGSLAHQIRK